MKIYPAPHQVLPTKKPRFLDIPVAHIEKEYTPSKINLVPEEGFTSKKERYLAPHQEFTNNNFLIFNESHEPVKADIRYQNHRYVYEPDKAQEFMPETFSFSALIKRKDTLLPNRDYDMRIGILEQENAKQSAQSLISIFGNAPYRGLSPANVKVNGRDTNPENLINTDSENLDFLFIATVDGSYTKDGATRLDYNKLMNNHCNLWITVTKDGMSGIFDDNEKFKSYTTHYITRSGDKFVFATTGELQTGSEYGVAVEYGAELPALPRTENYYRFDATAGQVPLLIIEKPNYGFVIVSHENLFNSATLSTYAPYIYNILTTVYLNSYVETNQNEAWIADDVVDYMGSLDMPFRKTHPNINLNDMVHQVNSSVLYYTLLGFATTSKNVIFDTQDSSGMIHFRKLVKTDPTKDIDATSVYTTQHTIIQYKKPKVMMIESKLSYATQIDEFNNCYFSIEPFVSSKYRLHVTKAQRFKIPDIEKTYALFALPVSFNEESELELVEESEWKSMGAAVKICTVQVAFDGDPAAYDIRMLGGGIPEGYTDFEMFDIGNLNGRPYRIGTGAVVKLPKAYKPYKSEILAAINKYKIAADQFYIIFD